MIEPKVLVVNDIRDCGASYYVPFRKFGSYETNCEALDNPSDVSLVVFCGGSDVSPELYGETDSTHCGYTDPERDSLEKLIFNKSVNLGLPIVGICRGAQFICAMCGGKVIQHVNGHNSYDHAVKTFDKKEFMTNSLHHQMMYPFDIEDHEVLAWSDPSLSEVYCFGSRELKPDVEPEAVHFKKQNAIGIQWHPEIMAYDDRGFIFVQEVCNSLLNVR